MELELLICSNLSKTMTVFELRINDKMHRLDILGISVNLLVLKKKKPNIFDLLSLF